MRATDTTTTTGWRSERNTGAATCGHDSVRHSFRPHAARGILFPLLVLASLAPWWYYESAASGYMTAYHLQAVLVSIFLISVWYLAAARGVFERER